MSAVWLVDASTARDQLRELAAQGFTATWIADRIGMARTGLGAIRSGTRPMVHPYTALAISRLHRRLHGANPADYGISQHGITKARNLPVARGWVA